AVWLLGRVNLVEEQARRAATALAEVLRGEWQDAEYERRATADSSVKLMIGISLSAIAGIIVGRFALPPNERSLPLGLCAAAATFLFLEIVDFFWARPAHPGADDPIRAATANALGHLGLTESVGVLAHAAAGDRNALVKRDAKHALLHILPKLTTAHRNSLEPLAM